MVAEEHGLSNPRKRRKSHHQAKCKQHVKCGGQKKEIKIDE